MSNYARYRDWHKRIGLILLVPLSVIATTGLLWNHEKALGLKQEAAPASGERPLAAAAADGPAAVALVAAAGAWRDHAAAIEAALLEAGQHWGAVELERIELKREADQRLVVKVKAAEDSDVRPSEIVWSVAEGRVIYRKGDPANGTDWAKLVHDLHTGKFFSKSYGFLWSDSGALAILALGATGVVLYLVPLLKKRSRRGSRPAGGTLPQPRPVARLPQQQALAPANALGGADT